MFNTKLKDMTKQECLAIEGLTKQQAATIKRWFWAAEKNNTECKLTSVETEEEVLNLVNGSFRTSETKETAKQTTNLETLSIEEVEELLTRIHGIIEKKKAEKLAEVEAKIKELEALKHELSK